MSRHEGEFFFMFQSIFMSNHMGIKLSLTGIIPISMIIISVTWVFLLGTTNTLRYCYCFYVFRRQLWFMHQRQFPRSEVQMPDMLRLRFVRHLLWSRSHQHSSHCRSPHAMYSYTIRLWLVAYSISLRDLYISLQFYFIYFFYFIHFFEKILTMEVKQSIPTHPSLILVPTVVNSDTLNQYCTTTSLPNTMKHLTKW